MTMTTTIIVSKIMVRLPLFKCKIWPVRSSTNDTSSSYMSKVEGKVVGSRPSGWVGKVVSSRPFGWVGNYKEINVEFFV